jgi:outer membrane immunogenic protein
MEKLLLAGAVLAVLIPSRAIAADAAARVDRAVAAPVFSWTGFYIGANAGYAWSKADVVTTIFPTPVPANEAAVAAADSPSLTGNGFTGGGQAGFNYQTGVFVWGIEADINYFRTTGSQVTTALFPAGGGLFTTNNSFSTNWMATVRPRLGVAFDRALFYATGGWAVTNASYNTVFTSVAGNFEGATVSTTRSGWTVGGGWEYAFLGNLSAKIEYLYMDFGHLSATASSLFLGVPDGLTFTHDVHLRSNVVRVGLNYKFGYTPAPTVYK